MLEQLVRHQLLMFVPLVALIEILPDAGPPRCPRSGESRHKLVSESSPSRFSARHQGSVGRRKTPDPAKAGC
jgi:hypothetical protein